VTYPPTLALTVYLAVTTRQWQFSALSVLTAVIILVNFWALWLIRKARVETGVMLIIAELVIQLPVLASLFTGIGLVLGITALVGIYVIGSLTLIQPQLSQANITAVSVGIIVILLDIFFPYNRLGVPVVELYVPFAAVIVLGIFAYFIIQEFQNYSLTAKLVIAFVGIVMISIGILGYSVNRTNSARLTQDVGEKIAEEGNTYAFIVGETLAKEISNLQALGLSKTIQDRVELANSGYVGDTKTIQGSIQQLDQLWRAADAANNDQDPLVAKILNEPSSSELRAYRKTFNENAGVLVTDQYGANVAATNRTLEYGHANEDWWQAAYNNGAGAVYINDPQFDNSTSAYAAIIAIPLYANNTSQVIGVLRTTLDINSITTVINKYHLGQTGRIELYLADGDQIPSTGGALIRGDPAAILISTKTLAFSQIDYQGSPSFVSRSLVASVNPDAAKALNKLGWSLIIHQDRQESLDPVVQQTKTITLISLLLIIMAGVIALFAAQIIARPIQSLTAVTEQIASGDLRARSNISSHDEIGTLANSFNRMTSQLQDTLGSLERRIAERTADVELARLLSERRAQDLQAISEVSRTISTEQRLEILLPLVTRLVSERFDFYHAGIFFVDATKQFAILQAANSEGGKRMLNRGHRLEVGLTGIVGIVAKTGKPRIALDVGSDAVYFDNPDLPNTRSEMALPLNFRGETIGVLDVQSTRPGAFTETDANTLSVLADQIAIAIENARLFGQTQQARDEAEALYSQFQRTEWNSLIQREATIGYRQSAIGGKPLTALVHTEEIRTALQKGKVVIFDGKDSKAQPAIAIPVQLRGQTIGVLNIKAPTQNRRWNQDEINLAQAISDRLALALDNARLLQESQRRAAKEAKIGEVTARIGASINMRNVLQTAVEELGRALPGSEVVIQFQQEDGKG
jgi:GAF domain-containing protein/HAMP domain-containing protein